MSDETKHAVDVVMQVAAELRGHGRCHVVTLSVEDCARLAQALTDAARKLREPVQ